MGYKSNFSGSEVDYILKNSILSTTQELSEDQKLQARTNIDVLTPYEYYKSKGGYVSEKAYNVMTKYLFTPFMISPNSVTNIPDELLNDSKDMFITDYYWNIMRITGGESFTTIQWKNNVPYRFMGTINHKVYIIDFVNKTITPEVATASLEEIVFCVNGEQFTTDGNITWENYINSVYNDGNWNLKGNQVYYGDQPLLSTYGSVYKYEIILEDENYSI